MKQHGMKGSVNQDYVQNNAERGIQDLKAILKRIVEVMKPCLIKGILQQYACNFMELVTNVSCI